MKIKNKKRYRIVISIITWVLCALSASFGYSFLNSMSWPFYAKFLVGILLLATPILVLCLIVELLKKEKNS